MQSTLTGAANAVRMGLDKIDFMDIGSGVNALTSNAKRTDFHANSSGLTIAGSDVTKKYPADTFENTAKTRPDSFAVFNNIELNNTKIILSGNLPAFCQQPHKKLTDFSTYFKDTLIKMSEPGRKVDPLVAALFLEDLKKQGAEQLEAQFKLDLKALDDFFRDTNNKTAFLNEIKKQNPNFQDADLPALEALFKKELADKHASILKKFNDDTDVVINDLYQQGQINEAKVNFIKALYRRNASFRESFDKQIRNNPVQAGEPEITVNANGNLININHFNKFDLSKNGLTSLTGRTISQNGNGQFQMEMPNNNFPSIGGMYYYSTPAFEVDTLSLAMAVRASGYQTITMNFQATDETEKSRKGTDSDIQQFSLKGGRTQLAACIEAGFKPKDITIVVNGTKYVLSPTEEQKKAGIKPHQELYVLMSQSQQHQYDMALNNTQQIDSQTRHVGKRERDEVNALRRELSPTPQSPSGSP
jgi:hypothetical protein